MVLAVAAHVSCLVAWAFAGVGIFWWIVGNE
jgi:hypothetical protein